MVVICPCCSKGVFLNKTVMGRMADREEVAIPCQSCKSDLKFRAKVEVSVCIIKDRSKEETVVGINTKGSKV